MMKVKIGDLVRLNSKVHDGGPLTPWCEEVWHSQAPMLVIPNPAHWDEQPLSGDSSIVCVLYKGKLRVLRRRELEIVHGA